MVALIRRTLPSEPGVGPRLGRVTEYDVSRWRELPSIVASWAGAAPVKSVLAPRFPEAIDEAPKRLGDAGADDYLAGRERSTWTGADGSRPRC